MKPAVKVVDEFEGTVTGRLSSKRGTIMSSETSMQLAVILAEVPLSMMFDYANELRSMTQGKGTFTMEFARYSMLPSNLQEEVVEKRKKEKAENAARS